LPDEVGMNEAVLFRAARRLSKGRFCIGDIQPARGAQYSGKIDFGAKSLQAECHDAPNCC